MYNALHMDCVHKYVNEKNMQSEKNNPPGLPLATPKTIIVILQKQNLSNNINSNAKVTF